MTQMLTLRSTESTKWPTVASMTQTHAPKCTR